MDTTGPTGRRRQRLEAIEAANRVRYARADLKDAIHADASWGTLRDVIAGRRGRDHVHRMRVLDALLAAPGLGPEKAKRLLLSASVGAGGAFDPLILFERLTEPRRRIILEELVRMRVRLRGDVLERIAATPRGYRSDVRDAVRRAWTAAA